MRITVFVEDAIKSVTEFKEKHEKDFELQMAAWRIEHEAFEVALSAWRNETKFDTNKKPFEPSRPTNFLKDYDKLLTKLKWHAHTKIELDDQEYAKIFEDLFGWSHTHINATSISAGSITSAKILNIGTELKSYAEQRLNDFGYEKK
jgi:hypothetical protein